MNEAEATDEEVPETLAQTNTRRIMQLNQLGVGINGVNESLICRMLERLLGQSATEQVNQEHQEWLSSLIGSYEDQLLKDQPYETMEALLASLEIQKRLQVPGRRGH